MIAAVLTGCSSDTPLRVPAELPEVIKGNEKLVKGWSQKLSSDESEPTGAITPVILQNSLFTASNSGEVAAYSLKKGKKLWEYDADQPISTGVAAAENLVVVVTRNGTIVALSTKGKLLWTKKIAKEVLSPALITPKTSDSSKVIVQGVDGSVIALAATDGSLAWRYSTSIPNLSLRGTNAPYLFEKNVIVGFSSGVLVALDSNTGKVNWERKLQNPVGQNEFDRLTDLDGTITRRENILFVPGYQGQFSAVEAYRGQVLWQKPNSSYQGADFYVDRLYIVDTASHLQVLDYRTGDSQWVSKIFEYRDLSKPSVFGDYLLVGDFEGYVHLVDRFSAKVNDQIKVGPAPITIIVDGEQAFARAANGKLVQLKLKSIQGKKEEAS